MNRERLCSRQAVVDWIQKSFRVKVETFGKATQQVMINKTVVSDEHEVVMHYKSM